jgi:hypothetical protein
MHKYSHPILKINHSSHIHHSTITSNYSHISAGPIRPLTTLSQQNPHTAEDVSLPRNTSFYKYTKLKLIRINAHISELQRDCSVENSRLFNAIDERRRW